MFISNKIDGRHTTMGKKENNDPKKLQEYLKKFDIEKLKNHFKRNIEEVDQDDIAYADKKGQKKFDLLKDNIPKPLIELWEDFKLMISILRDYCTNKYKEIPYKSIAAIVVAVIYFVAPIDFIPDFLPVIGYVDDALIIKFALDFIHDDLMDYKNWKEGLAEA